MDKYGMERRPSPVGQEKEPEYTIEQACEAYLKYEKTTAIPVELRHFFNKIDSESLDILLNNEELSEEYVQKVKSTLKENVVGTPPLRVYISRWKRDR